MPKSIFFLAFLFMYSCTNSDNCDQKFNEPFEVEEGQTYCLTENISIEILEISSSYCPCTVDCIWQGETMIRAQRIEVDAVEPITFHEVLLDENPQWGRISKVDVTEDCIPEVISVSIIVNN